ncbi:hypothetical protein Tco_1418761 [Tanacetum coccineum]
MPNLGEYKSILIPCGNRRFDWSIEMRDISMEMITPNPNSTKVFNQTIHVNNLNESNESKSFTCLRFLEWNENIHNSAIIVTHLPKDTMHATDVEISDKHGFRDLHGLIFFGLKRGPLMNTHGREESKKKAEKKKTRLIPMVPM